MKERIIKWIRIQDIVDSLTKRQRNELAMAIFLQTDNELCELEQEARDNYVSK